MTAAMAGTTSTTPRGSWGPVVAPVRARRWRPLSGWTLCRVCGPTSRLPAGWPWPSRRCSRSRRPGCSARSPGRSIRRRCSPSATCRGRAKTRRSPAASRSVRRSARTAWAWKGSWRCSTRPFLHGTSLSSISARGRPTRPGLPERIPPPGSTTPPPRRSPISRASWCRICSTRRFRRWRPGGSPPPASRSGPAPG